MKKYIFALLTIFAIASFTAAQREVGVRPTETGGPLLAEQAVFDVKRYDLNIRVDPAAKSISGDSAMTAEIVHPTNVIVLDLDTPYTVSKVQEKCGTSACQLRFERRDGRIWIYFPTTRQPGENVLVQVFYSGTPRVAPNPPWVGGFIWTKTGAGADWVSIAMQNDGADILFPVKDHPSDKADAAGMRVTVPEPLVAVGPGKFVGDTTNIDGTRTFEWLMTNPIPNYSILFDAGPYRVIKDSVKSITGETIPIEFYILPESYDNGAKLIAETKKYNAFFEKYLGPFPWRSQKLGIVETPHLGMEHSTHIAYGNKFKFEADGLDWLMLHEFGHEWWANLVTASDWRDFWIHEGFQSFMDTLYVEETKGKAAYVEAMKKRAEATRNVQPVAPREPKIAYQVYLQEPDYVKSDGDIYGKGAVILHTLRYLIGEEAFFRALRRMAYPTKEMESFTDGRQTRLVNTDDFLHIAEQESKMELDWFFELYLRQPKLPKLIIEPGACIEGTGSGAKSCKLNLRWETPNNLPFPMPIDLVIDGKTHRVEMRNGGASIAYSGAPPAIDPDSWILKAP
jgi:aminopeptidase N